MGWQPETQPKGKPPVEKTKREKMDRLIDADELTELVNWTFARPPFSRKTILHMIDMARRVDAVPVIRCKDCKFSKAYYHGSESNLGMFTYLCTQGLYGMNADDYCSRAERRADGAEHDN